MSDLVIVSDLLPRVGEFCRARSFGLRCAIVTDTNVAPLFAQDVFNSLTNSGFTPQLIVLPPGEATKSLGRVEELCEQLSAANLDRSSFLISLGGGVVGDLTGFVAAIFLRGIPWVNLPTTLLAQIDSCLGGKTGVNAAAGKNLIGVFHHPALVLADTTTLRTLPERIWNEGFAEAIKHAAIADAAMLEVMPEVTRENCAGFVRRNLAIKETFIREDERETSGRRALLNFGHTIGHAIERAAGYGTCLHGEAISLGMVAASKISVARAGLSLGDCEKILASLHARNLPTQLPANFPREEILAALAHDKKFSEGRIRFVVLRALGRAELSAAVTLEDLRSAIAQL